MGAYDQTPATRGDLSQLQVEIRTYYATKADLAQLEARLTRLIIGVGVVIVGALALIQKFLE